MRATKIKMRPGCGASNNLLEISEIYLTGASPDGFVPKEVLHGYLKQYPGTIQVNIPPYPNLIPGVSSRGEKYVKSSPNAFGVDNLLNLPRS